MHFCIQEVKHLVMSNSYARLWPRDYAAVHGADTCCYEVCRPGCMWEACGCPCGSFSNDINGFPTPTCLSWTFGILNWECFCFPLCCPACWLPQTCCDRCCASCLGDPKTQNAVIGAMSTLPLRGHMPAAVPYQRFGTQQPLVAPVCSSSMN